MEKIEKLIAIKEKATLGGGEDKIRIQHNLNKNTARERIEMLLDEGTFIEIGSLIEGNGGGVITGYGTVNEKLVYVYSQDYTVDGGALSVSNSKKVCNIMDMAIKMGAPLVQIIDSIGARVSEGLDILAAYGNIIKRNSKLSGVVPQIAVVAGPCTGSASVSIAMSDFTIMIKNSSEFYLNSPSKLSVVEKQYVDIDMYGDTTSCSKNGTAQLCVDSDEEAFAKVKEILSYLPSNNMELTVPIKKDEINYLEDKFNELIKDGNYDIYEMIDLLADKKSLLEINGENAKGMLTAFIRINGMVLGIIATNKKEQIGGVNIEDMNKAIKFTKLCDSFNISILTIVDTKGIALSLEEEKKGLVLSLSKLIYTLSEAKVPKVSLIVGKVYGNTYLALASKETAFDIVYAMPSAKISLTEPTNLIKNLYREKIVSSNNPKEKETEVIEKYLEEYTSPYKAAEKGYIDDVIMPSEVRIRLFSVFDMLQSKREITYPKKHGSILV